jgi:outer membrane protein OmpA-like peptidoglycan-associated protein
MADYKALILAFSYTLLLHSPTSSATEDNPLIEPYPGTTIENTFSNDLINYQIATGVVEGDKIQSVTIEGELNHILYMGARDASILRVYKSLESTLKENGFTITYSCENENCGGDLVSRLINSGDQNKYNSVRYDGPVNNNFYYIASKQKLNGVDHYLVYFIYKYGGNAIYIAQDIVSSQPEAIAELEVNLDFSKMKTAGKVILQGVLFETNSAKISKQSDQSLSIIADYIKKNPGKKFYVVGHTDSDGQLASNLTLSRARAGSVTDVLIKKYNIAAETLSPHGLASLSPIASNTDGAGKRVNRRVELVEQ